MKLEDPTVKHAYSYCLSFCSDCFIIKRNCCNNSANSPTEDLFWVSKASMNQPRAGLGVVAVDGKIYAIGGASTPPYQNQADNLLSINEQYDPTTNTWTIKPSMHTPRAYFAIAAYQHKIYCIGRDSWFRKFFRWFYDAFNVCL